MLGYHIKVEHLVPRHMSQEGETTPIADGSRDNKEEGRSCPTPASSASGASCLLAACLLARRAPHSMPLPAAYPNRKSRALTRQERSSFLLQLSAPPPNRPKHEHFVSSSSTAAGHRNAHLLLPLLLYIGAQSAGLYPSCFQLSRPCLAPASITTPFGYLSWSQ